MANSSAPGLGEEASMEPMAFCNSSSSTPADSHAPWRRPLLKSLRLATYTRGPSLGSLSDPAAADCVSASLSSGSCGSFSILTSFRSLDVQGASDANPLVMPPEPPFLVHPVRTWPQQFEL